MLALAIGLDFRVDLLDRHRLGRLPLENFACLLEAHHADRCQLAAHQILHRFGREKAGCLGFGRQCIGERNFDGGHDRMQ